MDFKEFIKPELLMLIPVIYVIGIGVKKSCLPDRWIPLCLGVIAVLLSGIWIFANSELITWQAVLVAVFSSLTQGILIAGTSVYMNQLYVQAKKEE